MLVDILILIQNLIDVARRRSLYSMNINPQNEAHVSVVVNILYTKREKYRDNPLKALESFSLVSTINVHSIKCMCGLQTS